MTFYCDPTEPLLYFGSWSHEGKQFRGKELHIERINSASSTGS